MPRAFGTIPHAEIAQAFERENRTHTFVEQLATGEHTKKYELRVSLEELLTLLDSLAHVDQSQRSNDDFRLRVRQLRGKILATLGLFEDG
jgi:hypothetical protein